MVYQYSLCLYVYVLLCMYLVLQSSMYAKLFLYAFYSQLVHLFCNYVKLCVDVGTHVATS
jgi:hypothetical protein